MSGAGLWQGRKVLVTGLGVSGRAVVAALGGLGARVTVAVDALPDDAEIHALREAGVEVVAGLTDPPPDVELVVTSPGFRPTVPLLESAARRGLPVLGEPELAWRLRGPDAAPWLALTGTDGKTTTVRMLESILLASGRRTVAAGNVGLPLVSVVTDPQAYDVLAVELSSAQLYWSSTIRPSVGALLNIAPDHLDWTGGFEAYIATKVKIWDADVAVANLDDPLTRDLFAHVSAPHTVGFTLGEPQQGQLGVVGGVMVDRAFGDGVALLPAAEVRPAGSFNVSNALAAAAMALAYGVEADQVAAGLVAFRPDPHRNEVVASVGGVTYVDNSKATGPHAAQAAVSVFDRVVWIAGGLNKGLSFDELVESVRDRLSAVVLLGSCQDEIADALARHAPDIRVVRVRRTDDGAMTDVVRAAAAAAVPGDTVLLAPAAASMDMYRDYHARGTAFQHAVRALADGALADAPEGTAE